MEGHFNLKRFNVNFTSERLPRREILCPENEIREDINDRVWTKKKCCPIIEL
jgi:hypothetical protein